MLYEIRHPEAKAEEQRKKGLKQYREISDTLRETPTFIEDTAKKTGKAKSSIRQKVRIAENLDNDEMEVFEKKEIPINEALKENQTQRV